MERSSSGSDDERHLTLLRIHKLVVSDAPLMICASRCHWLAGGGGAGDGQGDRQEETGGRVFVEGLIHALQPYRHRQGDNKWRRSLRSLYNMGGPALIEAPVHRVFCSLLGRSHPHLPLLLYLPLLFCSALFFTLIYSSLGPCISSLPPRPTRASLPCMPATR